MSSQIKTLKWRVLVTMTVKIQLCCPYATIFDIIKLVLTGHQNPLLNQEKEVTGY